MDLSKYLPPKKREQAMFSLRCDKELKRLLQARLAKEGITITDWVNASIKAYLDDSGEAPEAD